LKLKRMAKFIVSAAAGMERKLKSNVIHKFLKVSGYPVDN